MGDFDILYLCDRKACENCHEECRHTPDIKHAVHRYTLNGRKFQVVQDVYCKALFEVKED